MAVTNPTPPAPIGFSKNILNIVLQSDDWLAAAKAYAINFLQFEGAVVAADTRPLTWIAAATMVCAAVPDDSGRQFPPGDGGNAYVESLVPYFQQNYFIDRDFIVTSDITGAHPKLVFTARNYGPDYNFTSFLAGLAGITTPGVTDQPQANFAHHLEAWIGQDWNGEAFDEALNANIPLDYPLTGKTTADLHDELHAFLSSDYPVLTDPYSVCLNSIRPWFFRYAEFYGTPPFVRKITQSATFYINKGGLGKQAALLRDIVAELCPGGGDATKTRFLRQGSKNKLIGQLQPEWLTYINLTGGTVTLSPQVMIFYSDGSDFVFNAFDPIEVPVYQKIQMQAGFTQLGIAAKQPDKIPVYYTLQMLYEGDPATDIYYFVLDNTWYEYPRYFVYENSYGAFQTIATVGKGQTEVGRIKDDSQMAVNLHTAAIAGEFLETSILIQEKTTVNIGYRRSDKRNVALLRDFLLSRTKYLFNNGALIPIGIANESTKDYPDGANVDAEQIIYYPLYQQDVWTEDAPQTDDTLADLLAAAGANLYIDGVEGDYFYVNAGDDGIGADGYGNFVFTDPLGRIAGRIGYTVYATQLPAVILPPNITYNAIGASFTILIPAFALVPGYPLIVFTRNIDAL